ADELTDHRLVGFTDGPAKKLVSAGDGADHTFPPHRVAARVICDDGASMRIATKSGLGIGMNSLWNIHDDLHDGSLVRVLPSYHIADQSAIWLVYPKSNVLTAKVRVFIDFLIQEIGTPPVWEQHVSN
ncbi:MAG: LysR substrate-binding domain-containing protein, partial [Pseudomonadota bacterium]